MFEPKLCPNGHDLQMLGIYLSWNAIGNVQTWGKFTQDGRVIVDEEDTKENNVSSEPETLHCAGCDVIVELEYTLKDDDDGR